MTVEDTSLGYHAAAVIEMRLRVDDDWAYFYFLVPAIISFFFSLAVIVTAIQRKKIRKRRFDQLTFLIAFFSLLQSLSWFRARYERHSSLCLIQEYLFQFSTLMESSLALVICSTIHYTIKAGRAPPWYHRKIILWLFLPVLSLISSSVIGTAQLFCPFNDHHDLYYPNLTSDSSSSSVRNLRRFIGYVCCYLCPMALSWFSSAYYSYSTSRYANEHYTQQSSLMTSPSAPALHSIAAVTTPPPLSLSSVPPSPSPSPLVMAPPAVDDLMASPSLATTTLLSRPTASSSSPTGPNRIIFIAMQLRLYPIVLALCLLPLCSFFFLVIILNQEYHLLLFVGAILVNSTGTINGIVYLMIVRHSLRKSQVRSGARERPSLLSRRGFHSINYHLVISKLIKSSGQSYNIEADGDEAEDGGEEDETNEDGWEWSESDEEEGEEEDMASSRSHHSSYASSISQAMKEAFAF
jgi:hypothetical protein